MPMSRKKYIADEVPWISMLPHEDRPRVVACSQFGWLMSATLSPKDMSTATAEQRFLTAVRFCAALQTLQGGRWVWMEEARRPLAGVRIAPPRNRAAQLYVKDRIAVHGDGVHSASQHYLSVRHSPPTGLAMRIRNAFLLPEEGETEGQFGPVFDDFVRSFDRVVSLLSYLGAEALEGDDLAAYLRSTISVNAGPIAVEPYDFLAPQLLDSPLYGGKTLWLGHEHRRLNVRSVQINTYPHRLTAGALDFGDDTFPGLTELGYRIRRIKRLRTQARTESVRELEWLVKKAAMTQESLLLNVMRQFDKGADSPLNNKAATVALQEADAMLLDLYKDGVMRCQTTDNILVYDEDPIVARKHAYEIEEFLLGKGFGVEVNDLSNHECVLGGIPGKTDVDFVRPTVNLLAVAMGCPLTKAWSGDLGNDSPKIAYGTTCGTSRIALSLHINGEGYHGFLCGGTGGGKSSGLNALGIGHLAAVPGGRVIRVESGRSGHVTSKLVGGATFNLGEDGCGVQPYRIIDKPNDRAALHGWTMARIRSQLGARADHPSITQAVEDALRAMAKMDPDERTVSTFCLVAGSADAVAAMRLYSQEGALGHIFDAVDNRSYDADWINFELSAITEDEETASIAAPALISYLWRFIMRMSSSKRPLMLQLDEASAYVEGGFVSGLVRGLRTYRKMKTQVIFATQSILDLKNSAASHIILNSCPTQIYVQDDAVLTDPGLKVLRELGLSESDAQVIAGMEKGREYFLHRPGAGKAVITLDLDSPIARSMVLMTNDDHYQRARFVEKHSAGRDFLDAWMEDRGIDVADVLGEDGDAADPMRMAAE